MASQANHPVGHGHRGGGDRRGGLRPNQEVQRNRPSAVRFSDLLDTGAVTPLTPTDIATDIGLVQSATVKMIVAKSLKATAPSVSVAEQGTTEIATVSVTSTDPVFAARAANAYANGYIQASQQRFLATAQAAENQLQTQINALQTQINRPAEPDQSD